MLSLSVKLWLNLNPSQFWGIICTQKTQNSNFLKMFHPIFSLYAELIHAKKSEKFNALISYETQKTNFAQKIQCRVFPKKNHLSQF